MHIPGDDPVPRKDSDMIGNKIAAQSGNTESPISHGLGIELTSLRDADIAFSKEIQDTAGTYLSPLQNMKKRIIIWLQC